MKQAKVILHLISDSINSILLLYALLVDKSYTILFLIIIVVMLGTKIIADIID